jgi:hypothetical protein
MTQGLAPADIEAIERATLDAVPPQAMDSVGGWLLGLDTGTVGRAHSAVPLRHEGEVTDAGVVALIESRYAAHGLRAVFRVPVLPSFGGVQAELAQRGYVQTKPTCTFIGTTAGMRALQAERRAEERPAELLAAPDDAWRALFLGEGFDPADGAMPLLPACGWRAIPLRPAWEATARAGPAFTACARWLRIAARGWRAASSLRWRPRRSAAVLHGCSCR